MANKQKSIKQIYNESEVEFLGRIIKLLKKRKFDEDYIEQLKTLTRMNLNFVQSSGRAKVSKKTMDLYDEVEINLFKRIDKLLKDKNAEEELKELSIINKTLIQSSGKIVDEDIIEVDKQIDEMLLKIEKAEAGMKANPDKDDLVLLPYQKRIVQMLLNEGKTSYICAARRSGKTFSVAWAAVKNAVKNNGDTVYTSNKGKTNEEFIDTVKMIMRKLGKDCELIYNEKKNTVERIRLFHRTDKECVIKVRDTSKDVFRGTGKRNVLLIFDESAFTSDEMYKRIKNSASGAIIKGGSVCIISSMGHINHQFYKDIISAERNKKQYMMLTFTDAIAEGMYKNECRMNPDLYADNQYARKKYIQQVYDEIGMGSSNELDCIPLSDYIGFISQESINHGVDTECFCVTMEKKSIDTPLIQEIERLQSDYSFNVKLIGYDPATDGDVSSFCILVRDEVTNEWKANYIEFITMTSDEQLDIIDKVMNILQNVRFIAIDSTSVTSEITKMMEEKYPNLVIRCQANQTVRNEGFSKIKNLLDRGEMRIPNHLGIMHDLSYLHVKGDRVTVPHQRVEILGIQRHCDSADSLALAMFNSEENKINHKAFLSRRRKPKRIAYL